MLSGATQELFKVVDEVNLQKFQKAVDEVNLQKFQKAVEDGADVNAFQDDETPLMSIISAWAVDGNNEDTYRSMADLLIKNRNININIQNIGQRNTALHIAISFKLTEAVKLLLTHQRIDFSIKNDYQVDNYPYPTNWYNCTAIEYAKKLGTSEIVKQIEREIYRRTTLYDQAKSLLKRARPYIVKALIFAAFSHALVWTILKYGILHTLLALYAVIALGFHIFLLKRLMVKGVPIDKRLALFFGFASLYYFAVFADIVAGNGYFLISQLLFSVGTPLILLEEVGSIACYVIDISKSSEMIQSIVIVFASTFLVLCLGIIYEIFRNRFLGPNNHADPQQPELFAHVENEEFILIRRSLNEMQLEFLRNTNRVVNEMQLESLRDMNRAVNESMNDVLLESLRNISIENIIMR